MRCFSRKCEPLALIKWGLDSRHRHICLSCWYVQSLCSFSSSSRRSGSSVTPDQFSSQITNLINSCGLSDQFLVRCRFLERPQSVLKWFDRSGFSQAQLKMIVSKTPKILFSNAHKTLEPKIDFLCSLGISESEVLEIVTKCPSFFRGSLKNSLVPSLNLLTTLFGEKQNIVKAIKCNPSILHANVSKRLAVNLSTLSNFGVPKAKISKMMSGLISNKVIVGTNSDWFSKVVSAVIDMGFVPLSSSFEVAVTTMAYHSESSWKAKLMFYRTLGFSEEEILCILRTKPCVLALKEERIRGTVEFFASQFNWSPSQLSKRPNILTYSLEKRIIPRCLVLQVLISRKKILKSRKVTTILMTTVRDFLQRYVTKYNDEIPEVSVAYNGKMKSDDCNLVSEDLRRLFSF